MHLHINDQFQVIECNECLPLLKQNNTTPETPFSIHLFKDQFKYLILNIISQLELSNNVGITLNQAELKNHGIDEFKSVKVGIRKKTQDKEYIVIISKKTNEGVVNYKKYQPNEDLNKIKPLLSTNIQFERFFNRIEQVNIELDKRNKINAELISLNKQLLLKDQLLERNKNNVEALLNNNLQAFILVDTFYSIQAFNNKAKDLFLTISKKEIERNAFFFEYFTDEDLSSVKNDFKLINNESNHQFTVTRVFYDQTFQKERTFRVNYTAVLDKEHDLRSISIGFLDITNLVDARKELETSQNLISTVFSSTAMGIIIFNKNGDIVDVNRGASNNLNIPILKLKDLNIQSIFKDVLVKDEFPFFKLDKKEIVTQWKYHEDSVIKTFRLQTELLNNDSNNNLLVLTLSDITDEVLIKERLKNITNNIPGVVFRYLLKEDGTDQLLYVSEGAKDLWGFNRDQLMNDNQVVWKQYHPDDLEEHKESIQISKENMSEWFHEWRYIHPEKGLRWQRGNGKPTKQLDGSTAWDSIIVDITEEKKTDLNLKEKTKYLTILSEVNQELINYKDWETSIKKIFKIIGESMNIDRVYFFKYFREDDIEKMKHIYEWCSSKTFPQIDDPELQSLPSSHIPSITRSMHQNQSYHTKISDMPEGKEKEILLESGIKSIHSIPVRVRQKLFGLLGFDDCTKEREWSKQETTFLATVAQNISIAYEGHVAELKLIKEVKAREAILESIKDGFFSVNKNWTINYWNEEAQRLTGINKSDAIKGILWKVFPEINTQPIKNHFNNAVSEKKTSILESYFKELEKWFELNIYPTEDGASIYFKDITDRKEKEQELLLSHQRFEKVTEATNDAVWEWDIEKNTIYWGVGYEKQFGHKAEDKVQNFSSWTELIHPEDKPVISESLLNVLNEPKTTSWTEEYRYKNYDDSYSYVMDRGYIIRDENDKAIRMIGAMTDISHRKEYEESLEYLNSILKNRADELTEMNLELERFAYIASHDLQEPLRMITGFLSQLEKKYADQLDEKANQYIFYAVDGAKRMRKIILDLLQYSRIGKLDDNEAVELDLNSIIKEVTNILDSTITESNTTVNVSDLPKLIGFKLSFTQIFQNLISNAIKYRNNNTPPIIDIDYEENKTYYIFSVCDNGIGIDPKFHNKIFVIFQRLHNKDQYSGTGVGLAIVKKVVEQMGGEIWLKSNKMKGTTFYFSIPKEPKLS